MQEEIYLGFDTSNYTTSLAAVTGEGEILFSLKKPLPVQPGACGLRQSDALFAHTQNLPELCGEAREKLSGRVPTAVGVSFRPRNQEGSYMPCFLAGVAAAETAAMTAGIPLYRFSHQCGHLMAVLQSEGRQDLLSRPFAAFHVSGGTTEFLQVTADHAGFRAEVIGGTRDVNAGQIVDRIGVLLGLRFPCGPALEGLARQNKKPLPPRKLSVHGTYINLSGLQNLSEKLYRETGDAALTADFTLTFLAESLGEICRSYETEVGKTSFLFAGGVMSNQKIKAYLQKRYDATFAAPEFSRDNACGIAWLTRKSHKREEAPA